MSDEWTNVPMAEGSGGDMDPTAERSRVKSARNNVYADVRVKSSVPVEDDLWRHRSAKMKCGTCMWWVAKVGPTVVELGRCRRHSPTLGGWPAVYEGDWCGDHKVDENRL